jgi:hypothetical protein
VSSNFALMTEVYSIQYYVVKFVSDSRQVGGFFPGIPVSSTNKTDHRDTTEILLKVAFNTITLTPTKHATHPASTLRIHNVAVWLLFGQVPILRENYVATTYFRYVICGSL